MQQVITQQRFKNSDGLMVRALDSATSGPGSSTAGDFVSCSWVRHFSLTGPLSTQVCKWVPANLMLGAALRLTIIPSNGSSGSRKNTCSLHVTETGITSGLMGHLARTQTKPN